MLEEHVHAPDKGGPYIGAAPERDRRGGPRQAGAGAAVEAVLGRGSACRRGPESPGGQTGNTRIINLKDGSAADLAEAIRQLWRGWANRGQGDPAGRLAGPAQAAGHAGRSRRHPAGGCPRKMPGRRRSRSHRGAPRGDRYGVRDLVTRDCSPWGGAGQLVDPLAEAEGDRVAADRSRPSATG